MEWTLFGHCFTSAVNALSNTVQAERPTARNGVRRNDGYSREGEEIARSWQFLPRSSTSRQIESKRAGLEHAQTIQ